VYNKINKCLVTTRLQKHKTSYAANNLNGGWDPKIKWALRLENLQNSLSKLLFTSIEKNEFISKIHHSPSKKKNSNHYYMFRSIRQYMNASTSFCIFTI
jgi:late competence protein required for DNA uptake (superfamily II DNA/RNA helicase)